MLPHSISRAKLKWINNLKESVIKLLKGSIGVDCDLTLGKCFLGMTPKAEYIFPREITQTT